MAADSKDISLRPPAALSLYVHVPFCRSRCPYCDFFSTVDPTPATVQGVVEQIELQLEWFAARLAPTRVETVYVGGGTPSLLPPALLERLLRHIGDFITLVAFGDDAVTAPEAREWTVEANPESLSREHLEVCESRGVTRLSVGIQSFQTGILSTLGRPSGTREAAAALALLAGSWAGEINLDLMSGVPGQDWAGLRQDIEQALEGSPDHVSLYSLTLDDPEHPLARAVDPGAQERLWLRGRRLLESRGYRNYEISSFARSGRECRHNLRYWRLEPYLGVGAGAVSTLPGREGEVLRLANPESLSRYLQGSGATWNLEVERVSPREFLFETLMMGLRLSDGIAAAAFLDRFGTGLPALLPGLWSRWGEGGLLTRIPGGGHEGGGEERYALSFRGHMLLNRLLIELQEEIYALPESGLNLSWG